MSDAQFMRPHRPGRLIALIVATFVSGTAAAVPVPDLYSAEVPSGGLGSAALDDAFTNALGRVLVKVTGRRSVATDPSVTAAVGSAAPLVTQYRPLPAGRLSVQFDPAALRRRLDAANLPVWPDDRPLVRVILPARNEPAMGNAPVDGGAGAAVADDAALVASVAADRGIPVTVERGSLAADPGAAGPGLAAAGATNGYVLVARAGTGGAYHWTLHDGQEAAEWNGDATVAIHELADRLSSRFATVASASRPVLLRVRGVDDFDAYGRLHGYLRSVGMIQAVNVMQIDGSSILFEIDVRGEPARLRDALAVRRVIQPEPAAAADAGAGFSVALPLNDGADLVYRMVQGQ